MITIYILRPLLPSEGYHSNVTTIMILSPWKVDFQIIILKVQSHLHYCERNFIIVNNVLIVFFYFALSIFCSYL